MEYSVPREHAVEAVRRARAALERHPVSFPIELRFSAADDALLSPAHGRDSAFVAVHVFRGMAYEAAFREVEAALSDLGGRPHWGKRSFLDHTQLAPRYQRWTTSSASARRSIRVGASPTSGSATCWDDAMKTFNIFAPSFEYDDEDPDGYHAGMARFGARSARRRWARPSTSFPRARPCARTTTSPTRSG